MSEPKHCAHPGCKARPLTGSDLCHFHSPDRQAALAEARRKGGANSHKGRFRPPTSEAECREMLANVAAAMLNRKIPSRVGQPVIAALNSLLKGYEQVELARLNKILESQNAQSNA